MIRFFAGHPTASLLLALTFIVAGLIALPGIQRDTFPDYRRDRIEIRIAHPGASATEVEETICLALEDALDGLAGIDELTCTARSNVGIAQIDVLYGYDVGRLLTDVKTEIDAIDTLPAEVERPVVRQLDVNKPVVSLALTARTSAPNLKTLAEDVKARLSQVPGVAEVTIGGFSERRLEVSLDEHRLRAYGLSAAAVAAAIKRQSIDLPAGSVETGERDILLRFVDRRRQAADLEQIVLRDGRVGGTIHVGDVATVSEGFVDAEMRTHFNGERAALINIRRAETDDALRVFAAVEEFVTQERERLSDGVSLELTNDASSLIADRLNLLLMNALQGFALICLVLWAFFSIRFSLTVAAALPLSLLASIFVIDALGYNLNLLSTVGLLIAVGLLIDSAIVINENIARHVERGLEADEAAVAGVREVAGAVISSFLTSVAIFAPLAFLEGDIGRVLRVVPVVLSIVLAASLVVSFLILPYFTSRALARVTPTDLRQRIDCGIDAFRGRVMGALVRAAIAWRYLTLGLVAFAFLASLSLLAGGTVKFQPFPDIEGDIVEARLMLAAGTPLKRTMDTVDVLIAALTRVAAHVPPSPDGQPLVENVTVEYGRNADVADQGPHLATVKADILGSELRSARASEIVSAWRAETGTLTDVASLTFTEPAIGPAGQAIEIRLSGENLETLGQASADLMATLERYEGVIDLTTNLHAGARELRLSLREGAGRLGIDAFAVASQLRAALQGITADEIQVGRESVRIDVRHAADWRTRLGRLDDFTVILPDDGRSVPLSSVATVEHGRGLALIPRVDRRRTVTVTGDVDTALVNANEAQAAVEAEFRPLLARSYPGVSMSVEGQAAKQAETAGSLRRVFAIGLIAMFIVLSFQFRSYVEPLIVMLAIPLALTGVIAGHWLMDIDMSMPSMVGFVSLAGIVVNNSILLVVFIRHYLDAGRPVMEAAHNASLDRFRAILMTTATTVAGLVPLLFETSVQAQVLIPLVTSLAFGLVASTVLVLFLVPALYVIIEDIRAAWGSLHVTGSAVASE